MITKNSYFRMRTTEDFDEKLDELSSRMRVSRSKVLEVLVQTEWKKYNKKIDTMKTIIKQYETFGEVRTHLGNGKYLVRENVKKEHIFYTQNNKIYKEEKHDGELYNLQDVSEYYNLDGSEKNL